MLPCGCIAFGRDAEFNVRYCPYHERLHGVIADAIGATAPQARRNVLRRSQ